MSALLAAAAANIALGILALARYAWLFRRAQPLRGHHAFVTTTGLGTPVCPEGLGVSGEGREARPLPRKVAVGPSPRFAVSPAVRRRLAQDARLRLVSFDAEPVGDGEYAAVAAALKGGRP